METEALGDSSSSHEQYLRYGRIIVIAIEKKACSGNAVLMEQKLRLFYLSFMAQFDEGFAAFGFRASSG